MAQPFTVTYLDFGTSPTVVNGTTILTGQLASIAADASAYPSGSQVLYTSTSDQGTQFLNQTNRVLVTVSAYNGGDNAQLGVKVISFNNTGFYVLVSGGAPGSTVTVNYEAFGS